MMLQAICISASIASIIITQVETQNHVPQDERFIGFDVSTSGNESGEAQASHYSFETGEKEAFFTADISSTKEILSAQLLKPDGILIRMRLEAGQGRDSRRIRAVQSGGDSLESLLDQHDINSMSPVAVSPNGKRIALFDYWKQQLVVGGDGSFKAVQWRLSINGQLAWSRDSAKVAFYYADSARGHDDPVIQKHGIAVLGVDGNLQIVWV